MTHDLRRWMKLCEAEGGAEEPRPMPTVFYHATPMRNWPIIQHQGLLPSNASSPIEEPRIYLARQPGVAEGYAANNFGNETDEPWAIIEIDGSSLDMDNLGPDLDQEFWSAWTAIKARGYTEDDEIEGRIPWWVTFEETGQCIYKGTIPPTAVKLLKVYEV